VLVSDRLVGDTVVLCGLAQRPAALKQREGAVVLQLDHACKLFHSLKHGA